MLLSEKKIPKWCQYEWLISKIFHDKYSSFRTKVINNTSVMGEYSERSRQIDVLVENDQFKTMIECKYYSIPIDIKAVEAFLSMFSDVKADFGILISSSGFTKSAVKRIRQYPKEISLEHIDWESAYENSFDEETYDQIKDVCAHCFDKFESGKEVPGLLCWEHGFAIEIQGKVDIYSIANCLKCNSQTVFCQACGCISIANNEQSCCENRDVFLEFFNET